VEIDVSFSGGTERDEGKMLLREELSLNSSQYEFD
jgi:hypothetical protein